jgi:hypothetical protein
MVEPIRGGRVFLGILTIVLNVAIQLVISPRFSGVPHPLNISEGSWQEIAAHLFFGGIGIFLGTQICLRYLNRKEQILGLKIFALLVFIYLVGVAALIVYLLNQK